jgi:branched-chain amino acid transport system substrate-binding protein
MREVEMKSVAFAVILIAGSSLLCFVLLREGSAPGFTPFQPSELIIGADFALSGNMARYGTWAANGVALAVDEINQKGGIKGKAIRVNYEDNKGETAGAIAAYHKLRGLNFVRYVFTYQSSAALAVSPLANKDAVVQMDVSATTPHYSTPDDYTFRTAVSATQLAAYAAQVIYDRFNVRRLGIVYLEVDFGQGMADAFCANYRGEIAARETIPEKGADFRVQLLKMKKTGVRDIWFVSHLYESGILLRQARELGLHARFFTDMYSVEGPEFIDTAREAAEGVIYFSVKFDADDKNPAVSSFAAHYRERFGEAPTYFSAQAYDGVSALARALNNCAFEDTACVKKSLFAADFSGASGRIAFDRFGDVKKELTIRTIHNGQFTDYGDV